jgi:hypothetical protein
MMVLTSRVWTLIASGNLPDIRNVRQFAGRFKSPAVAQRTLPDTVVPNSTRPPVEKSLDRLRAYLALWLGTEADPAH